MDNTRKGYHRAQKKFACQIYQQSKDHPRPTECTHFKGLIRNDLYMALEDESQVANPKLEEKARRFILRASKDYHPINLTALKAEDFVSYLLSMAPAGQFLSKSTYGGAIY